MTATEELRRLLDERGVEWRADDGKTVWVTRWVFNGHSSAMFSEYDDGECVFVTSGHSWTPEQAVAATLGRGACKVEEYEDTGIPVCSECGAVQPEDHTVYFCWCCGRKVEG